MILGYVYVLLAVLSGSAKGAVSKKLSCGIKTVDDNLYVNTTRMLFCIVIGMVSALFTGGISSLAVNVPGLLTGILSGASFAAFTVLWMSCVQTGALVMIDVFLTAGIIIPLIGGQIWLDAPISPRQWIGFLILMLGVAVMCSYNNSIKPKMTSRLLILLILCGAANGVSSFAQKLYLAVSPDYTTTAFNFYTYLSAFVILGVYMLIRRSPVREKLKDNKLTCTISLISIFLYVNLLFKMLAGGRLSAVQIYPMVQGLGIVNSSLVAALFFGEKINRRAVIGMLISFIALLLINL